MDLFGRWCGTVRRLTEKLPCDPEDEFASMMDLPEHMRLHKLKIGGEISLHRRGRWKTQSKRGSSRLGKSFKLNIAGALLERVESSRTRHRVYREGPERLAVDALVHPNGRCWSMLCRREAPV